MQNSGRKMNRVARSIVENPYGIYFTPTGAVEINGLILRELQKIPEIRMGFIQVIKRAIAENRYFVPEEYIAERMIYCYLAGWLN
jgi:hypothetical protein